MASTPAATEKVEMLKVLFALSDPSEFGDDDPFGAVAGGIEGMIGLLVSRDDVTVQQVPREKNPYSMLKLGQLAGQANLGVIEQLTLGNFVECGFGEAMHEKYEKGFTSAEKAVASAAAQAGVASKIASAAGSKKNRHPSDEEAATLKGIAGVTWQEAVACQVAVTVGIVPDIHEIEAMGYGSNPLNCDAAKAKAGKWVAGKRESIVPPMPILAKSTYSLLNRCLDRAYRDMIAEGKVDLQLGDDRESPDWGHYTWRRLAAEACQAVFERGECSDVDVDLLMGWRLAKWNKQMRLHYSDRGVRTGRAHLTEMI